MACSVDHASVVKVRELPCTVTLTSLRQCDIQRCTRAGCNNYHSMEELEYWRFCLMKRMCKDSFRVSCNMVNNWLALCILSHSAQRADDWSFDSFCEQHTYPEDITSSYLMDILESEGLSESNYKLVFRLLLYLDELEQSRKMIAE